MAETHVEEFKAAAAEAADCGSNFMTTYLLMVYMMCKIPLWNTVLNAWQTWCGVAPQCDDRVVPLAAEVIGPQEPFLDIVQDFAMHSICWPLPLQLEDQHATVPHSLQVRSTHTS